jgi:hypothetical protein
MFDEAEAYGYKDYRDVEVKPGHRITYLDRLVSKNTIRIFDSDEYTENELESYRRQDGTNQRFGVIDTGGNYTPSNTGDALWPKAAAGCPDWDYQPGDVSYLDPTDANYVSKWNYGVFPYTVEASTHCYAVMDMHGYYYASKCTRAKRHVLWLKPGTVPGWAGPVVVLWDDVNSHIDATFDEKTVKWQLYSWYGKGDCYGVTGMAGSPPKFTITRTNMARMTAFCIRPATIAYQLVRGFKDDDGEVYSSNATWVDALDPVGADGEQEPVSDTGVDQDGQDIQRIEIWPATASTTPQFLFVFYLGNPADPTPPTPTLFEDGTYYGVTIGTMVAKMKKGDTHGCIVSSNNPPGVPTALSASPVSQTRIDLSWTAPADPEADLDHYHVYQSVWAGGAWGAWSAATNTTTTTFSATGLTASTTYRFKVSAVDTSAQEGSETDPVSATTNRTYPSGGGGGGVAAWRPSGRLSKFTLKR